MRPEVVEPKNMRDQKLPSEALLLSEQIREHSRNRRSKSALGLAVTPAS